VVDWFKKMVGSAKAKRRVYEEEVRRFKIPALVKIPVLPEVKKKEQLDVRYPLIPPFAYARVRWDAVEKSYIYEVTEPSLTKEEEDILKDVTEDLTKALEFGEIKSTEEAIEYLKKKTLEVLDEQVIELKPGQFTRIFYFIYRNFIGLNEIEPLMHDSYIEDLGCDGINVPVYVVHKKYGVLKTNIIFPEATKLSEFVVKLAERCGRYVSYAEPLLDGSLPDGSRVQATLAKDVTRRGPTFSIRKFREIPYSAIDLIKLGTASAELMAFLWYMIEKRRNIMIVGGTATGKCLTGDTPVLLANGERIPIGELVESRLNRAEQIGVTDDGWFCCPAELDVMTLDRQSLRIRPASASMLWKRKAPEKVLKISTSSGEIRVTPEHPFFVLKSEDGSLEEIRADKLRAGDFIVAPRMLKIEPTEQIDIRAAALRCLERAYVELSEDLRGIVRAAISEGKLPRSARTKEWARGKNKIPLGVLRELAGADDLAKITCLYTGNGAEVRLPSLDGISEAYGYLIADGHLTPSYVEFRNENKELLQRFLRTIEDATGVRGKIERPKNGIARARVFNAVLAELFHRVFGVPYGSVPYGKKAAAVGLPDWLCASEEKVLAAALRAIFDCESSVSRRQGDIELTSSSRKLTDSLAYALRRFGIVSRIAERKVGYGLVISGKSNVERYATSIGFLDRTKSSLLERYLDSDSRKARSNIDLLPIGDILDRIRNQIRNRARATGLTGLSDIEIASAAGMSGRGYERVAAGERSPAPQTLLKISSALLEKAVRLNLPRNVIEEIEFLQKLSRSDIILTEVKNLAEESCSDEWVYDLTIPETHNFVAGSSCGFVAHNTTFLNSISIFIPPEEKVVSIEDTAELNLPHENWIPAVARTGFGAVTGEGLRYGEVTMFDLLRESFRQAPDYVIVGEVRGREASVLFQGMASGHASFGTMHGGSVDDIVRRLQTPPIELPPGLLEVLDLIIVISRAPQFGKSARRVKSVNELVSVEPTSGKPDFNVAFVWDPARDEHKARTSVLLDEIAKEYGLSVSEIKREIATRRKFLEWLRESKVYNFKEVSRYISLYYKNRSEALRLMARPAVGLAPSIKI